MDTTIDLYESIDVWRRVSERHLVRYRCFRNLRSNRFAVQSSDFYSSDSDITRARFLEEQYVDLLRAQNPDERSSSFDSLDEAIRAHDLQFGELG